MDSAIPVPGSRRPRMNTAVSGSMTHCSGSTVRYPEEDEEEEVEEEEIHAH